MRSIGEPVHADGHFAHALHDGAGESDVLLADHDVGMIHVIEMVRRVAVMLHEESRLAVTQQELDALVFVLGLAEAAQLEDAPRLGAIALWEAAAMEWRLARPGPGKLRVACRHVLGAIAGLQVDA